MLQRETLISSEWELISFVHLRLGNISGKGFWENVDLRFGEAEKSVLLDRQQFFDIQNTTGTLVGYHLPEYLNGIQVSGFHLHYLSSDTKQGGHVLGFKGQNFKIEIAVLKSFELEAPTSTDFQHFQFIKKHNEDLERVEQGK